MKVNKLSILIDALIICILWLIDYVLVGSDSLILFQWWLGLVILGLGFLPLSKLLFSGLADKGYFASKLVGTALGGFVVWLFCQAGLPFSPLFCIGITLLVMVAVWGVYYLVLSRKEGDLRFDLLDGYDFNHIALEEILFVFFFLMWAYLIGFRPQAFGTEKMMDYGFMAAMMRSDSIPVTDMWYSEGFINYYYGGQYYCTYLTKLFLDEVCNSYNVLRAVIAAVSFVFPFEIVYSLLKDTPSVRKNKMKNTISIAGGSLAGFAMSFAGNMHYCIFYRIVPAIQEMLGINVDSYWFPDSTRYIGYRPDVEDKTIHEFPSYSFVLGDMHAHMINILFVLLMIAILYSWGKKQDSNRWDCRTALSVKTIAKEIFQPEIIFMTLLIAIYQWTNFWDYPIYFGLAGLIILTVNIRKYGKYNIAYTTIVTIGEAVFALAGAALLILPFTLQFDTIFQGVALTKSHTRFYQLLVLWGLPVITILVYIVNSFMDTEKPDEEQKQLGKFSMADLFTIITGIWGIVLILVPEVMYVIDIYGSGFSRSNTMFKFTYQGYILFAIVMSYAIVRMICWTGKRKKELRRAGTISLLLVLWTCGYFFTSVRLWFGDVKNTAYYQGLDATAFLEKDYPANAGAIRWLEENVSEESDAVVLEVNGLSYTAYNIVSAMTGIPTVLGWYTHEWLWRNDTDDLNLKSADIQTIYTSENPEMVKTMLDKYNIKYVFVGSNEWEKYPEINPEVLEQVCDVVYVEPNTPCANGHYTVVYKVK